MASVRKRKRVKGHVWVVDFRGPDGKKLDLPRFGGHLG
jgi:hypothetical protein